MRRSIPSLLKQPWISLIAVGGVLVLLAAWMSSGPMRFRRYSERSIFENASLRQSYGSYFNFRSDPTYVWHLEADPQSIVARLNLSLYFPGDAADLATAIDAISEHIPNFSTTNGLVYWRRGNGHKKFVLVASNEVYFVLVHF